MKATRFDALSRSLTRARSRREALTALLGGVVGILRRDDAGAKTKQRAHGEGKKKRRKKKKQAGPLSCPAGQKTCGGGCIPSNQCCTPGDCPVSAPRCCQGACKDVECCSNADCGGGKICQTGACLCPPGTLFCPEVSTETCCAPVPGMVPTTIACETPRGEPSCFCRYDTATACGPDCNPTCPGFGTSCADSEGIAQLCTTCGCPLCDPDEIRVERTCVSKQGSCPSGASSCPGPVIGCNGKAECKCFTSAAGETRCGKVPAGVQCGQCTTDAQCQGFGKYAFCVTQTAPGTECICGTAGLGICIAPCPA